MDHAILSDERASLAQKDMERFWVDLDKETDRGMVLSAGAYFEQLLEDCLGAYFSDCKEGRELLVDGNGLGTFSARNKCCIALRIIEPLEYATLRYLASIRNKFAHRTSVDFSDPDVKDLTFAMTRNFFQTTPRFGKKLRKMSPANCFHSRRFA